MLLARKLGEPVLAVKVIYHFHETVHSVVNTTSSRWDFWPFRYFFSSEIRNLQVHIEVGPANEGMKRLADQGVRWDLAFIDADKTGYLGYYNQVPTCLHP
jgi:hypothetical protein